MRFFNIPLFGDRSFIFRFGSIYFFGVDTGERYTGRFLFIVTKQFRGLLTPKTLFVWIYEFITDLLVKIMMCVWHRHPLQLKLPPQHHVRVDH